MSAAMHPFFPPKEPNASDAEFAALRRSAEAEIAGLTHQIEAVQQLTEATRGAAEAIREFSLAWKRDRHCRLFGHPLARVFIGNRLLVSHPQVGAA